MSNYQVEAPRVGVALFDNPTNPLSGICSLAGSEAVRFRTVGDLLSDCIWITNLTFQQAYSHRLHNNPKIKISNFLRIELERIAIELNLDLQRKPIQAVQILSQIADRTITLASRIYGVDKYKDSLKRTIEDVILLPYEQEMTPFVTQVIDNSYKSYQNCWGHRNPENAEYYLRFQRTSYAKTILRLPVPKGTWRRVNHKFPLTNGAVKFGKDSRIYKFLEELTAVKPALLKVSVKNVHPSVAHLLDYGQGTEQREWVPVQEIAQIAAYSDVTILDMLLAEGMEQVSPALSEQLSKFDAAQDSSFSFGLIAESHLHSIFSKRKITRNGIAETVTPARASWLRAWDRVICFAVAAKLENNGFRVLSYGIGNIQVSCSEKSLGRLTEVAQSLNLTMPMAMVEHLSFANECNDLMS